MAAAMLALPLAYVLALVVVVTRYLRGRVVLGRNYALLVCYQSIFIRAL